MTAATTARRNTSQSPADDATDAKVLSRRVLVNIRRDQTTETPRVVWAHEVPILQLLFGDDEVRMVDPKTMDEGYSPTIPADMRPFNKTEDRRLPPSVTAGIGWVFTGDPQAEYERLAQAYGRHREVPVSNVEHIFGRFATGVFSRMLGRPTLADLPDSQLRDLILAYGYEMPLPSADASSEDRDAAARRWTAFRNLPRADLLKLADDVGVELG